MTWNWWVSQGFAFLALCALIIALQRRTAIGFQWWRGTACLVMFVSVCFLGEGALIILLTVSILRSIVALFFAYRPNTPQRYKIIAGVLLVALLVTLNVVFWESWLNAFSIVLGIGWTVTFLQKNPATMRKLSVVFHMGAVVLFALTFALVNMIVDIIGTISAVVGIIRVDRKAKIKTTSLPTPSCQ